MDKKTQFNLWYLVAAIFGLLIIQSLWSQNGHVTTIPYSEFEGSLRDGKISEVVITEQYIQGTLKGVPNDRPQHVIASRVDPALAERLDQYDVKYSAEVENTFLSNLLSWLIPIALFFGIWMFAFRRIAEKQGLGGMMSIGKSNAKVYVETDIKVGFHDVAGVDEAKGELQEIVDFLKEPARHSRLGARMPKGILLVGPPGTGKTLLARAVAGEAGVPFFSIGGSEFVEMFVGVGAARVRDLFEQARKAAPAIIFIDELDALGRARGAYPFGGGHDEKEQTLNQLLSEMDGFDPKGGVIILAATNRPEILDPALLRAGRFDRQVLVDRPDKIGRAQILGVHVRRINLAEDADIEQIAALTPGFSGADLANLVNEAALLATRRGADAVTVSDFTQAVERIVAGLEKRNKLLNPHERKIVAFHELGHAFVALSIPGSDTVHKVSIIPRGVGALGYTIQRPTEDRYLMSRSELENRMAILLGGRAAESIAFHEVSTGAADDLVKATDIARSMVARFGMVQELGQVAYEDEPHRFLGEAPTSGFLQRRYSEPTAERIDNAMRKLVEEAFNRAVSLLEERRETLDHAAGELLKKETLSGDELKALFEAKLPGPRRATQATPLALRSH